MEKRYRSVHIGDTKFNYITRGKIEVDIHKDKNTKIFSGTWYQLIDENAPEELRASYIHRPAAIKYWIENIYLEINS